METLAQFVQKKRDKLGISPSGLAKKCNLALNIIEDIEAGKELFLPVTARQKLAKGLRCHPEEIRQYEKDISTDFVSLTVIECFSDFYQRETKLYVSYKQNLQL